VPTVTVSSSTKCPALIKVIVSNVSTFPSIVGTKHRTVTTRISTFMLTVTIKGIVV
jgi:hypothetical protein